MKKVTSELLRNELFRKSNFSGSSVVIPYTSEGALAKLKRLEVVETRQKKRESSRNICQSQAEFWELGMYNSEAGQKVAHSSRARCKDLTAVAANTEIYFNTFNDEYSFVVRTYDENKAFINSIGEKINGTKLLLADNIKYISNTIMRKGSDGGSGEGQIILNKIASGEIKPFICLSSETNKEFEEYGVKPSLYDTAEVECVGDNVQLFKSIDTATRSGITFVNNGDGSYTLNGTSTKDTSFYVTNLGYEAGTYTLSANNSIANSSVAMQLETSTGNKRFALSDINSHKTYEVDDINVLSIIVASGTTLNDYVICPKLEKGSKATSLSKFGQGSVEISTSNENIIPFAYNTKKMASGVELSIDEKGVAVLNGTATVKSGALSILTDNVDWKADKFPYGKKVTFICKGLLDGVALAFAEADKNHKWLRNLAAFNNDKEFVITTCSRGENTEYIRINFTIEKDVVLNNVKLYIALVEGETNEYIGPKHSTLVMPTQQRMLKGDYFDIENKKEVHSWERRIFDGTEDFGMDTTNKSFYVQENRAKRLTDYKDKMFCNCYSSIENFTKKNVSGVSCYHRSGFTNQNWIYFTDENYTTVDEFKAMLAQKHTEGNPIYVDFMLAEEEKIDCIDEQKAVLSELESMNTYDDTTIITIDNDMTEMTVEAEQSRMSMLEEKIKKEETV